MTYIEDGFDDFFRRVGPFPFKADQDWGEVIMVKRGAGGSNVW